MIQYGDVFNGGKYLKIERLKNDNMNQKQLSEQIGMSISNISKIENQKLRPKKKHLEKWINALEIDTEQAKEKSSDIKTILETDEEKEKQIKEEKRREYRNKNRYKIKSSEFDGGLYIKECRIYKGLRLNELAALVEEPIWRMSHLEHNKYRPKKELLDKIFQVLDINCKEAIEKSKSIEEILKDYTV